METQSYDTNSNILQQEELLYPISSPAAFLLGEATAAASAAAAAHEAVDSAPSQQEEQQQANDEGNAAQNPVEKVDTANAPQNVDNAVEGRAAAAAVTTIEEGDVLSGRGAFVNAHAGNKKFRALCFSRKPEFDAANHTAKRRIAMEIVQYSKATHNSRFLKQKTPSGPWYELSLEQALLKACQVMRDHRRPDRLLARSSLDPTSSSNNSHSAAAPAVIPKKQSRATATATPMDGIVLPTEPLPPIVETPNGVHPHDVLCGRGAFVNGHVGNQRLRDMAIQRKVAFDRGEFPEKRSLASEIVTYIKSLDPPGRFLKQERSHKGEGVVATAGMEEDRDDTIKAEKSSSRPMDVEWIELTDEEAIHKACQVMRDIDRPDRKDRLERKRIKLLKKQQHKSTSSPAAADTDNQILLIQPEQCEHGSGQDSSAPFVSQQQQDSDASLLATVEEAGVAAEAVDKALEAVNVV